MRVLIVEDDQTISSSIKRGLQQEGFAVDVCSDGESGYLMAQDDEYDVIILDILLPSMDGLSIAHRLREDEVHARIVMLSAQDQISDKITGLNTGADDYMAKPFSFEELLARINALLRRPSETTGDVLHTADLELQTSMRTVTRAGKPIALSTKEFAILEYMLRNKGKVLSKNSIVTHVWNFDADILPHTVEAFIAMLRAKIDKPFAGPNLIKTVRGFGYSIGDGA